MEQREPRKRHRVEVADSGGSSSLSLVELETGRMLCRLMENVHLQAISDLTLRHDDIILCSYPRTGTHWTWELMRMLIKDRTDQDPTEKEVAMFEYRSHGELDSLPSPRILNTHLRFEELPRDVWQKASTKLVLTYRHPKDVAVSFYNLHRTAPWYNYQGTFQDWLPLFMQGKVDWGSYADYLRDWERVMADHPEIPIHLVSYERLMENPTEELSRLSAFLGRDHDVGFLQEVSEACTIDQMRIRKMENYAGRHLPGDGAFFMYRKGQAGGWRDWFTVAMSEQFDRYWTQAMQGSTHFAFH